MNQISLSSVGWQSWLIGALVLALLWLHAAIVVPFALAVVLAYVLRPMVIRLQAWRLPQGLAIGLCLLLVALVAAVRVVLLVPIVSELVPMLRSQLPDLLAQVWTDVAPRLKAMGLQVPDSADEWRSQLTRLLQEHVPQWSGALWHSVVVGGGNVLTVMGLGILVPMLAFYVMADWASLTARARALLPQTWRTSSDELLREIDDIMGQYLRGQLLVMLILAVYYSVGLAVAGFSLALPIGVFTGLAVCIPYIGFGLGLVLALLAGVLQFAATDAGWAYPLIAVGLVYGIGQFVESFLLTPRLVGERIGLHPLGVILALMLFGQWLGFWGLLIALPCTALLTIMGRRGLQAWQGSRLYLGD